MVNPGVVLQYYAQLCTDYIMTVVPNIALHSVRPEPFDTLRTASSKGRSWFDKLIILFS